MPNDLLCGCQPPHFYLPRCELGTLWWVNRELRSGFTVSDALERSECICIPSRRQGFRHSSVASTPSSFFCPTRSSNIDAQTARTARTEQYSSANLHVYSYSKLTHTHTCTHARAHTYAHAHTDNSDNSVPRQRRRRNSSGQNTPNHRSRGLRDLESALPVVVYLLTYLLV